MRLSVLMIMVMICLLLPIQCSATNIYPSLSYYTMIESGNSVNMLENVVKTRDNYIVFFRNNGTNVYAIFKYYNHSKLISLQEVQIENFTLISLKLTLNTTSITIVCRNNETDRVLVYLDLYEANIEDVINGDLYLFGQMFKH
jgi:hypothetical protein